MKRECDQTLSGLHVYQWRGVASRRRSGSMLGKCGGCGFQWGAAGQAHCKECHEHFNSDTAFDRHREGTYDDPLNPRRCVPRERFSEPYQKSRRPRLVQTGRKDGPVWVTALADFRTGSEAEAMRERVD